MTIAGFQARNHPQQVGRWGANPRVDDRATDPALFERLDGRFRFTLDAAASARNAKCARYFSIIENGLEHSWAGERVWCNPPYSSIRPWVEKAWAERWRAVLIVMLLPANRTEQPWWQELIEPFRDGRRARNEVRIEFIAHRQRFVAADADAIGPNERPPFGVCLAIWDSIQWGGAAGVAGIGLVAQALPCVKENEPDPATRAVVTEEGRVRL